MSRTLLSLLIAVTVIGAASADVPAPPSALAVDAYIAVPEIPGNGIDDNLDGTKDEAISDCWTANNADYYCEAESAQFLSPMVSAADTDASGGSYVHLPLGNHHSVAQLRLPGSSITNATYYLFARVRNLGSARRIWIDDATIPRYPDNATLGATIPQRENFTWELLGTADTALNLRNKVNGTAQRTMVLSGTIGVSIMSEAGIHFDKFCISTDANAIPQGATDSTLCSSAAETQSDYVVLDIGANPMPTIDGTIDALWAEVNVVNYSGVDTGISGAPVTRCVWDKDASPQRIACLHTYTRANLISSVTADDTDVSGDTASYIYFKLTDLDRARDADTYLVGVNMNATQAVIDANWPSDVFSTTVDLANFTHGRSYSGDVLVIEYAFDLPNVATADQQFLVNFRANERISGQSATFKGAFNASGSTAAIEGWGVGKLSSTGLSGVADETAPTVNNCSAINVGSVSFDARCDTDEAGSYLVKYDSDDDGAVSGGDMVTVNGQGTCSGTCTLNVSGLTVGTLYEWQLCVTDAAGNQGCGAVVDTTTIAEDAFYIATDGDDGNDGSSLNPWKTWAFALAQLDPGETLIVKNGEYDAANGAGWPNVNCSSGYNNGTSSQPITIRAENERQAWLKGAGENSDRFRLENCSWWRIEGLRISDADNASTTTNRYVVLLRSSTNNVLRRLLVHNNNRYVNSHLVNLDGSHNNLIEEVEAYNFNRHAIIPNSGSDNNIIRRVYCNSRSHGDIQGGFPSGNSSGGDSCVSIYPGSFNTVENVFAEGNPGQLSEINASGQNRDNKFYGVIFDGSVDGSFAYGLNPNARGSTLTTMPRDITCENCLFYDGDIGIRSASAKGTRCDNCTFFANTIGVSLRINGSKLGDSNYSFFGTNINILSAGTGVRRIETDGTWTVGVDFVNTFNVGTPFSNLPGGSVTNATTVDPSLGSCFTHIRDSSPLKGAGLGGADIGANVLFTYENGVKTSTKLLDSTTGEIKSEFYGARVNDAGLDTMTNSIVDFISRLQPSCNWATDKPAGY